MSAASRRLHVSQSALSQTVSALERELGVTLLERTSTGVRPTEAGATLLAEARAILSRYHQAVRTMSNYTAESRGVIRLGIPLELDPDVLPAALAKFAAESPHTRVAPQHLSTAAQFIALRGDQLDVGLVRERPSGSEFDAMPVAREPLGVLVCSKLVARLAGPDGVQLDQLAELHLPAPHGLLGTDDPEIFRSLSTGARAALRDVEAALRRMDAGRYGLCVDCGTPIAVERLEILPQTARCLLCQQPVVR